MDIDRHRSDHDGFLPEVEPADPAYKSLQQASRLLPPGRNGRPVHIATLIRWITSGSRGPSGEAIRLRAIRMGHRWLTTREWLDEFAQRLTPTYGDEPPVRPSTAGRRSAERVARELDSIGIK